MNVAFFGLGAMGEPMARHLLQAGHKVGSIIFETSVVANRLQKEHGLIIHPTPAEAIRTAEVVLTILPDDADVLNFLISEELAQAFHPGMIILEMSSCTPKTAQTLESFYTPYGVSIVDAPVSGGVMGAQNGKLTVFCSGTSDAQQQVQPVLEPLAETVYDLGPCGMGKTIKNLDNLLSMYNLMGLCEAYHIAMQSNVDPQMFFDVIGSNSGASKALTNRWFNLVNGNFEPGFTLRLARKDIGNALKMGEGIPLPMSHLLHELMNAAKIYDNEDVNALRKLFEHEA